MSAGCTGGLIGVSNGWPSYKCLLTLYYGLAVCPMNKSHIKSLNFALNSAGKYL